MPTADMSQDKRMNCFFAPSLGYRENASVHGFGRPMLVSHATTGAMPARFPVTSLRYVREISLLH